MELEAVTEEQVELRSVSSLCEAVSVSEVVSTLMLTEVHQSQQPGWFTEDSISITNNILLGREPVRLQRAQRHACKRSTGMDVLAVLVVSGQYTCLCA